MPAEKKINVALAGLGFGAEFVPIYLHHPWVESLTIRDPDAEVLQSVGDRFEVDKRVSELDEVLSDENIDAVHLVTPIPLHAEQTVAVLPAGKHCACTVPMATSIDDLNAIVAAQRESGKVYMGMETAVYTRRFMYVQEMLSNDEIGRIQFLRGAHYQDMEYWPSLLDGLAANALRDARGLARLGAGWNPGAGRALLSVPASCGPNCISSTIIPIPSKRPSYELDHEQSSRRRDHAQPLPYRARLYRELQHIWRESDL